MLRNCSPRHQRRSGVFAPSGSGKSTLIKLVNGLESFDSGSMRVSRLPGADLPGLGAWAFLTKVLFGAFFLPARNDSSHAMSPRRCCHTPYPTAPTEADRCSGAIDLRRRRQAEGRDLDLTCPLQTLLRERSFSHHNLPLRCAIGTPPVSHSTLTPFLPISKLLPHVSSASVGTMPAAGILWLRRGIPRVDPPRPSRTASTDERPPGIGASSSLGRPLCPIRLHPPHSASIRLAPNLLVTSPWPSLASDVPCRFYSAPRDTTSVPPTKTVRYRASPSSTAARSTQPTRP